jgi:hypothetical protein
LAIYNKAGKDFNELTSKQVVNMIGCRDMINIEKAMLQNHYQEFR